MRIADIVIDIQPANIMIQIPDEGLVADYLNSTHTNAPDVAKSLEDYAIIPSQSLREDYFQEGFNLMDLDICLSDWGVASFTDRHLSELIQPTLLRAPEVILEAPWGCPADIWNLGALIPELFYRQHMFSGADSTGSYLTKTHLAEIEALLGPFPANLLAQVNQTTKDEFFNPDGSVADPDLSLVVTLEQRFSELPEEEAPKFQAFVRAMLTTDPEKRKTAEELLEEPWLKHEFTEDLAFGCD